MQFNVGRPPGLPGGDEQLVPFAFNFLGMPLAKPGKYVLELSLDGTPVRKLAFRVIQPTPQSVSDRAVPAQL